ncbi:CBS domain-containing protein [Polynucleobacter sp. IMCC30063]|uniref:CBS domain-containing protein n=1 Tax=unclassified Polynucleobacter TaxID=2640945 RepID=UPI001F1D573A|nr:MULTISPECIES: CBS domain-containing protein [unclassified Polynucleobacter]MCE7504825.1 CBS domain-containing protein [Polynucleobacter sp. IMCC30063]MCE7526371.1 CBS domain-containing protein [Polynucleobacter sp. IMCC 30228]MCE7530653.1 CBS domain-containing protein [Polynucleobacter sp. IMCC 29146]
MASVKSCLEQKSGVIISVQPNASVSEALQLMRNNRVRAVLVIEGKSLLGIVSQGDCAIKVLLPELNPKTTQIHEIMTKNLITVSLNDDLDHCMGLMASSSIRHLPVLEQNQVVGVVSIGDIVKNIISQQGDQIKYLETYIKGHGVV